MNYNYRQLQVPCPFSGNAKVKVLHPNVVMPSSASLFLSLSNKVSEYCFVKNKRRVLKLRYIYSPKKPHACSPHSGTSLLSLSRYCLLQHHACVAIHILAETLNQLPSLCSSLSLSLSVGAAADILRNLLKVES